MSDREVGVALVCFGGEKTAAKARKPLETKLQSNGDVVLQTTIVQVNAKEKASVHDVRRVVVGTLTAALTWGLFGLVAGTNRVESTIVWAVIGAVCGGLFAYASEHVLTKSELARVGRSLGPQSSALVTFAETSDATKLLAATAPFTPSAASVALVDADLGSRVFVGTSAVEVSDGSGNGISSAEQTAALSMLVYRYPDPKAAAHKAAEVSKTKPAGNGLPQIELVIETDQNGHRHVSDPSHGTAAWARADVVSWGLFGLVVGAIAGAVGGGGLHGLVKGALATGIGWAVFGLFAGALYGLWAGRSISARRLKGIGPLLARGTSAVVAWTDGPIGPSATEAFSAPGSKHLFLRFNSVPGGAVLEAD